MLGIRISLSDKSAEEVCSSEVPETDLSKNIHRGDLPRIRAERDRFDIKRVTTFLESKYGIAGGDVTDRKISELLRGSYQFSIRTECERIDNRLLSAKTANFFA